MTLPLDARVLEVCAGATVVYMKRQSARSAKGEQVSLGVVLARFGFGDINLVVFVGDCRPGGTGWVCPYPSSSATNRRTGREASCTCHRCAFASSDMNMMTAFDLFLGH